MTSPGADAGAPGGDPSADARLTRAITTATRFVWRAGRREFIISAVIQVAAALSLAAMLLFGGRIVDELTAHGGTSLEQVMPVAIGLGVAMAISGLATVLGRRYQVVLIDQLTRHVEREIIEVASSVDYEMYETQDFNDLLDRATRWVASSSYAVTQDLMTLVNAAATSVVVTLVLARAVPGLLGILVLIFIPALLAARASARLAYRATYRLTAGDRLRGALFRALTGKREGRELRVFGLGTVLTGRWERLYEERLDHIRGMVRRVALFEGIAVVIASLFVAGALVVLVAAAADGRIGVGDAAVAVVAMQQLAQRLRAAAATSGSLRQSAFHLHDFERFHRMRTERPAAGEDTALPRAELMVDHVSFRYPGTEPLVLDDVSLRIGPGEIVALVGLSGGGKTTLAHLVAGLYRPTAGAITYGGVDIATIPRAVYWHSLAAVFQDFVRYELSARENIAMSDHTRLDDLDAVRTSARRAGIDDALERLPDGYETMMSRAYEGGADLSVGQWQRVAVARAFFREAPLLILDEPAAALDAVAEQRLYERLVELVQSRSVLLVSHRFSTVRLADRICVVEAGRILEQGTHAELIALDGRYAELFNLQASGYDVGTTPET